jgi:hypothetical protein
MMGAQEIAIMTVVAIWLGIIVILLILGFRFKAKNGLFLKERHAQEDDFAQHKDKFTLQPVDISYELPVGELGYFVGESMMFKKPLKQNKWDRRFEQSLQKKGKTYRPTVDDDDDDDDLRFLHIFKLEKQHFSVWQLNLTKPVTTGTLYVTNVRLLIAGPEKSYQIPLQEMQAVNLSLFTYKGAYYRGLRITTAKTCYYFTYLDVNVYLTLNQLLKK